MAEEQAAQPDAGMVTRLARDVLNSTEALTKQVAALRTELATAQAKAAADIEAAKQHAAEVAAAEVAAERKDRRRASFKFAVVVGLDILLSLSTFWLVTDLIQIEDSLRRTQQQVLCPLYEVFGESIAADPGQRAALSAAQQKIYDETVKIVHDGYVALDCRPATPPLPTPSSPSH